MKQHYAVRLDCEHASTPETLWRVTVWDAHGNAGMLTDAGVWVPHIETWTPDTLRMFLYELHAFLPAHDEPAMVGIEVRNRPRPGRAPKRTGRTVPRAELVTISIVARGWKASVLTWLDEKDRRPGDTEPYPILTWSEPMAALFLSLAKQPPFPLDTITRVSPADDPGLIPARSQHIAGVRFPDAPRRGRSGLDERRRCIEDAIRRLREQRDDQDEDDD